MIEKQQIQKLLARRWGAFPICIPSYKRWDRKENKTITGIIEKCDAELQASTHVFVRAEQEQAYRESFPTVNIVVLPEVHGLAGTRQYIQDYVISTLRKHTGAYRNTPRPNHVAMNGQRVPVDQPFELEGIRGGIYAPMYPRDTILPPEETVNCHCIAQPVVDEDTLGLPLEERQQLQREAVDSMDDAWERELDARNRAKAGIEALPHYTDVTKEYSQAATPGVGTITQEAGYNQRRNKHEIEMADFLHDMFGGDITLLTETNVKNEKTPDYRWRGRLWDLKMPSTEKAAASAVRHATLQIAKNPGGVILDYQGHEVSVEKVLEAALSRIKRSGFREVDLIIFTKDRTAVDIFRYKK